MDPNLFYLDFERLLEVLAALVILSFFIERALSVLFESRSFVKNVSSKGKGFKELIAFTVSAAVCIFWKFDVFSTIFVRDSTTILGAILTGGIVAGGSKASIKLFKDFLGIMSTVEAERKGIKKNVG